MKDQVESCVTLSVVELKLFRDLKVRLRLQSNVEVVRHGLRLLRETTDRAALRSAHRRASEATGGLNVLDRAELDVLSYKSLS